MYKQNKKTIPVTFKIEKKVKFPVPILGLLGVLFIGLKLSEVGQVAQWEWWQVLAPFWAIPALFVVLLALALTVAIIWGILAGIISLFK